MTKSSRLYHKSNEFLNEAFVQQAIEAYFIGEGFQIEHGGYSDLVCHNSERGQRWIIEAKGQTSQVGLDFRTGLGQLLQVMHDSRQGVSLFDVCTSRMRRNRIASIAAKMRAKLLPDCHH